MASDREKWLRKNHNTFERLKVGTSLGSADEVMGSNFQNEKASHKNKVLDENQLSNLAKELFYLWSDEPSKDTQITVQKLTRSFLALGLATSEKMVTDQFSSIISNKLPQTKATNQKPNASTTLEQKLHTLISAQDFIDLVIGDTHCSEMPYL